MDFRAEVKRDELLDGDGRRGRAPAIMAGVIQAGTVLNCVGWIEYVALWAADHFGVLSTGRIGMGVVVAIDDRNAVRRNISKCLDLCFNPRLAARSLAEVGLELALLMWGETGPWGAVDLAGKRRRTAAGAHERLLEMRKMNCTNLPPDPFLAEERRIPYIALTSKASAKFNICQIFFGKW